MEIDMTCSQSFSFTENIEVLSLAVINNIDYFYFLRDRYWYANKFVSSLRAMLCHFHWYEEHLKELNDKAYLYDFSSEACGNGFRSFVLIFERCFSECYTFCKNLSISRNSLFFRAGSCLKKLNNHVSILDGLRPGLKYITKLLLDNNDRELLTANKSFTAEKLIEECGMLNQLGFYGRYQGFYYCPSMRRTLQGVSVIMAAFSDLYQNTGGPVSRAVAAVLNGVKYALNPELRAQQIVNVAQNSSVEFLKAFWSLSETHFMKQLPSWVCPRVEVIKEIFIPSEPVTLCRLDSHDPVVIPAPSSHIPPAPVRCLLLSSVCRQGQLVMQKKNKVVLPSRSLLFHCHGGGFISQTPESHEIYLRSWAHDLNVPILSVDYSLSPQAPFPRALEEVLLAYAWTLNNAEKLGWTGENICFAGDSAGGNILMGTVLKTIALGVRQPDAVLCAYTPLILDMVPSPSRLLCWLDPLLPLGFMLSCLDAYAGAMETEGNEYEEESRDATDSNRQRKVSSISEILDSSLLFLKECEWVEVEANEPSANDSDVSSSSTNEKKGSNGIFEKVTSCKDYVSDFVKQFYQKSSDQLTEFKYEDHKEHDLFNFPQDLIFDVRKKCSLLASSSFNKLSKMLVTTAIYRKLISPILPFSKLSTFAPTNASTNHSILQKIKKLKIVTRNPFMSPLLVSDDYLKHMPPVYFVSLNFDPCLDDSVTFAKRLVAADRRVVFDVLDGLPHGFLNFLPFSQEAHNGSDLCVRRLKEALNLESKIVSL